MRFTDYHGWEVPEHGDDYDARIQALIDLIDEQVLIRRPRGARPAPGIRGRWFLATDQEKPTLSFDTGDAWVGIGGEYELPNEVTYADRPETITAQWSSDVPLDADLDGTAETANEADHAKEAENAMQLGGTDAENFAQTDREETITEEWEYDAPQIFRANVTVEGVINLPQHSGSDPPAEERQLGSMWFRTDRQPSG